MALGSASKYVIAAIFPLACLNLIGNLPMPIRGCRHRRESAAERQFPLLPPELRKRYHYQSISRYLPNGELPGVLATRTATF